MDLAKAMTITKVRDLRRILPKTYDHRRKVLSEVCTVLSQHQNLEAVIDKFVFNDGTVKNLISLTGTVMVFYEGKRYNIPVCLWLNESYPRSAPICYVKPTRDMMIVSSRHVNSNGEIMLPYLEEWRHTQCDLHSLIQVIMAVFSEVPPVCMRQVDSGSVVEEFSYTILDKENNLLFCENNETSC
ncbi:Tumor susceptibility gene 101 protein ESCRT-I complex subunit TSG101 [Triplophysa tibetana]|uniref:Tumor susceptibility gene 101 protein ESCRT-I complex subunit TSG101 n=1 Tax=Triplophysa tibetana TaxID=1572043 RepID=A0A5A9PQT2_9TELE|nr:Tumor susceptibility gene 101 protein ESCRT-I complex subunit TSG101 [Triplophysa tibetana]